MVKLLMLIGNTVSVSVNVNVDVNVNGGTVNGLRSFCKKIKGLNKKWSQRRRRNLMSA